MSLLNKIEYLQNLKQQNKYFEQELARSIAITFTEESELYNILVEVAQNPKLDGIYETYEFEYQTLPTTLSYKVTDGALHVKFAQVDKELRFTLFYNKDEELPWVSYLATDFYDYVATEELVRTFCEKLILGDDYFIDLSDPVFGIAPSNLKWERNPECDFLNPSTYEVIKNAVLANNGQITSNSKLVTIVFPNTVFDEKIEIYAPNENNYRSLYHIFDGAGFPLGHETNNTDEIILKEVLNVISNLNFNEHKEVENKEVLINNKEYEDFLRRLRNF